MTLEGVRMARRDPRTDHGAIQNAEVRRVEEMTWESKALALPLGSPTCTTGKKPEDSEVFCM